MENSVAELAQDLKYCLGDLFLILFEVWANNGYYSTKYISCIALTENQPVSSEIFGKTCTSKVIIFSWQLFHYRLPTSKNLSRRKVFGIGVEPPCLFCSSDSEMEINIFMHCHFSWYVWYKIFIWFGLWIAMLGDLVSLIQNVRKGWRWCDTWLCGRLG
jgi:hypothetical protein